MNALIALGGVVVGGAAGLIAGTFIGDRTDRGSYLPIGALIGALVGAGIGASAGAVVAVAVFS
jgi:hypothetical protein